MNITSNLQLLVNRFGEQHDIRMVPSAIVGTNEFMFRVTLSNLPHNMPQREYSAKRTSYDLALADVIHQLPKET